MQTSPYWALWGWVRLKVHFVIWYQSHFEPILASVCVGPIRPPKIYSPTHELAVSAWGECVGDPTSTRDKDLSLYISGFKPHLIEPVLWGWVRLKVHFVILILIILIIFLSVNNKIKLKWTLHGCPNLYTNCVKLKKKNQNRTSISNSN